MTGHMFVCSKQQIQGIQNSAAADKRLLISPVQLKAGAGEIQANDAIFLCLREDQDRHRLGLVAKAKTGVANLAKADNGSVRLGLKFAKPRSYLLSRGVAVGSTLQRLDWKKLTEAEVAAAFFDTEICAKQVKALRTAVASAIPTEYKGDWTNASGVDPKSVLASVVLDDIAAGGVTLREWYDEEILLRESCYKNAMKRRLTRLNGLAFQHLMGAFFAIPAFGLHVTEMRDTGDHGVDLDLVHSNDAYGDMLVVAQCKRWHPGASVGEPEVRGFRGVVSQRRAARGIFITTSDFTKPARDFAAQHQRLHLINGDELTSLFFRYANQAQGVWKIIQKDSCQLTFDQTPPAQPNPPGKKKAKNPADWVR